MNSRKGKTTEKSGVYAIITMIDSVSVVYVGSSRTCKNRWSTHKSRLRHGIHANPRLQRVWDKYGETVFRFLILEVVADADMLYICEKMWLDIFTSICDVYNMVDPDRTAPMREEIKLKIGNANKGRKRPDGLIANLAAFNSKPYPALENSKTGDIIPAGSNLRELAREHDLQYGNLHQVVSGKEYSCKGWHVLGRLRPEHQNAKCYPAFQHRVTGVVLAGGVNLSELCRHHDLDMAAMSRVMYGTSPHHKGWRLHGTDS